MSGEHPSTGGDWLLYRRLLSYVSGYWYLFLFSIAGYVVYSLGNVLLADLMQYLLDSLGEPTQLDKGIISGLAERLFGHDSRSEAELARIVAPLAILLIAPLRALGFFAGAYFISLVARNLVHTLRSQLFERMLLMPASYYEAQRQGSLVSRLTFTVEQVTGAATKALKTVLREGFTVIGLLAYMLYLNWRLCLVFALVAPFIALVVRYVGRRFRRYSRRIQASMADVTQVSGETFGALPEIKVYGGQARQRSVFERASRENRDQSLKLELAQALSTPVIQTLLALALGALVWLALSPSLLASFSPGSLVAFLVAAGQLGKPIKQLSGVQSVVQRGLAACEDIFRQLDQDSERDTGNMSVPRVAGRVCFENVSFTYPGAAQAALQEVSLDLAAGTTLALVGPSGSGKSTLVKLLARLYDPGEGRILLDGVPLQDYTLACLRGQIGMVSQSPVLFRDSVRDNIAYGALADAPEADVRRAAAIAHAADFIERLPQGFDTLLQDDGAGLSGGQRQRLAIARAVLKDAPVLVLDEATSALDNESEQHIRAALAEVTRNRTTIIIAHRLATVEQADTIAVMQAGRIIACGSHRQLLAAGGLYTRLYQQGFAA